MFFKTKKEAIMKKGKAGNLALLSTIRGINVPRFVVLSPGMSVEKQANVLRDFLKKYRGKTVAVRSSADQEDSAKASFAGMYMTKLRVPATFEAIQVAVEEVRSSGIQKGEVIAHYAARRSVELTEDRISVIVQEMIEGDLVGVILSHDLMKFDGYYVVSVSDEIGEAIVGGAADGKLIRVVRGVKPADIQDTWLRKLIRAMKIIEGWFRSSSLDVEFVFRGGLLYILQCRPITMEKKIKSRGLEGQFLKRANSVTASTASRFYGDVFGDMIDINPAELLGTEPTSLDISVFKNLFADKIIERVRREMGYDPLDAGLLQVVEGKPYVSMRASAFSFRPCGIPGYIYERMISVYRSALVENPALQSRVEFDLYAMSCGDKLEHTMEAAKLSQDEKGIVRGSFERIDKAFSEVSIAAAETFDTFAVSYERCTMSIGTAPLGALLEHIASGTEMFTRVARLAFYWKNRFQEMHPRESFNDLITGHIQSVSGQLQSDLVACRDGAITRGELVRRYGHLQPGQFSVFGECYADDPDTYLFVPMAQALVVKSERCNHIFETSTEFRNIIMFMQARERMKFLFSQSLHLFARRLRGQLKDRGISESKASGMDWKDLEACLRGARGVSGRRKKRPTILLPDVLIPGVTDLRVVMYAKAMPSYITRSVVKAPVLVLERLGMGVDVKGFLVLLPNADPGYDFLFHSGVAGIITKVGGPASHMCNRSVELQMPACIGCGESVYQKLAAAGSAVLDCNARQIIVVD